MTGLAVYIILFMQGGDAGHRRERVAVLWDESYLWGLIAFWAFHAEGFDFDLVTAGDAQRGRLGDFDLVFVPGGWASDKIIALGDDGAAAIREFVEAGGGYLGFCGGAGLALSHDSGLGLLPLERLPTSRRLPSFSGTISLRLRDTDHPAWDGIEDGQAFHAWWPGQFSLAGGDDTTRVLADYGEPGEDSFVTDLPLGSGVDWKKWEESYGINLDPARIIGEPALVASSLGGGTVLLSYIHFETPGDVPGRRVLKNLVSYVARRKAGQAGEPGSGGTAAGAGGGAGIEGSTMPEPPKVVPDHTAVSLATALAGEAMRFDRFGVENLLWYRRRDWLLQWRRGVRGIEYSTLDAMLKEIANYAEFAGGLDAESNAILPRLSELVKDFYSGARRLLMLERLAMTRGPLSPLKCGDPDICDLREKLFSTGRRCGGQYRQIVELADGILVSQLRRRIRHG